MACFSWHTVAPTQAAPQEAIDPYTPHPNLSDFPPVPLKNSKAPTRKRPVRPRSSWAPGNYVLYMPPTFSSSSEDRHQGGFTALLGNPLKRPSSPRKQTGRNIAQPTPQDNPVPWLLDKSVHTISSPRVLSLPGDQPRARLRRHRGTDTATTMKAKSRYGDEEPGDREKADDTTKMRISRPLGLDDRKSALTHDHFPAAMTPA